MSLNKPEFKVEIEKNVAESEKHSSKKEEDTVHSLSIFFYTLIFLALSGTVLMIVSFDKYWSSFVDKKPEGYKIPSLTDLWMVLYILPFIIAAKVIFEYSLQDLFYPLLEKKYLNPNDEENFKLGLVYKKKTATCRQACNDCLSRAFTRLFNYLNVNYSMIETTLPEPTVRPPSRIAKRRPCSIATG